MPISNDLLDEPLKGGTRPEELLGEAGLMTTAIAGPGSREMKAPRVRRLLNLRRSA